MPMARGELSLRDFRVFNVILLEQNLTKVADRLDTTQPAISKILARLRSHFQDPLFIRVGYLMQPTPRATQMAVHLRALLGASEGLKASPQAFNSSSSNRQFKLLMTDVGMINFLPRLMARMEQEGPKIGLHVVPLDSRHFELKLETGEADLAIGAFPRATKNTRRQALYTDSYVGVARRDHPRLSKLRTRAAFIAERHVIVVGSNTGHAAHQVVQEAHETAVLRENVLLRLPSFMAGAVVASRTDALAILPANLANFVADDLKLAIFMPPLSLPRIEIGQYWHERYHADPGHRWFRGLNRRTFGVRT